MIIIYVHSRGLIFPRIERTKHLVYGLLLFGFTPNLLKNYRSFSLVTRGTNKQKPALSYDALQWFRR